MMMEADPVSGKLSMANILDTRGILRASGIKKGKATPLTDCEGP